MSARPVVLMGPPAVGKSTLGRALAARLSRPFVDVDARVEQEAGRAVAELFESEGEPAFRARERRALLAVLEDPRAIVAAGGGALVDPALRRAVLKRAHVLALEAPLDALVERASSSGDERPLLAGDPAARLEALLRARAEGYAEAHARLLASGPLYDVVERAAHEVSDLEAHEALVVPLGARSYLVRVEPLRHLPRRVEALSPSGCLVVTDARVEGPCALDAIARGPLECDRVVLPGEGDRDKTLASLERIWDAALDRQLDRRAMLVGIGGGVVTDLTGFAAATLLRGVRFAAAPTTLLAMVDASVGGKTGIDRAQGKNLVGAFHQPSVVVCDPAALATLPARDLRAGLAEVVKIALACDEALLRALEADAARLRVLDLDAIAAIVPRAIQAKIDVVAEDEREAGARALLNFGHTIGHALEQGSGYAVPHGECVAHGMRAALDLGERLGVTPPDVARRARALLDALLFDVPPPALDAAPLDTAILDTAILDTAILDKGVAIGALASDKKRRDGTLRFVLLEGAGRSGVFPVAREDARFALERALASFPATVRESVREP